MCPACYIPFIAGISTFLATKLGLGDHFSIDVISWIISIGVSIGAFYLIKFLYKKYKG